MPNKSIINAAILEAAKSQERVRMGGVLYRGSNILDTAYSTVKYIGYRRNVFRYTPTHHVEVSLMHNKSRSSLCDANILVVRLSGSDVLTNSKPCISCVRAMKKAGIRKCYYYDYSGNMQKLVLALVDLENYTKDIPEE